MQLLSIIIPIYNEEKTIEELLKRVLAVKLPIEKEIICVDDGSKDRSADIIRKTASNNKNVNYIHKQNGGKGSAVKLGLQAAHGDVFIIQDADLEYDPNDYNALLYEIGNGHKVVYGSRYLSEKGHLKENQHLTFKIHKFGNNMLSFFTTILFGQKMSDMETCYKMFTRDALDTIGKLKSNKFNIEPEITAKFLKNGFKIKEIPINYFSRDFSEGKKITWKDGVKALFTLIYYRIFD